MARKRNSILDAIAAFNGAYDTVNKVGLDYKLADIANSKVETIGTKEDVKSPVVQNVVQNSETTVPDTDNKVQPVDSTVQQQQTDTLPQIKPSPVVLDSSTQTAKEQYKFLGKTYDKAPTESEQLSARNLAMAGVLKSFGDPIKGIAMEMQARQGAREETRFQKEQDYEKEFSQAMQGTRFGQNQQQYNKALGDYQQKLTEYEGAKASGKTGAALGLPPAAPSRPDYTIGDQLADRASMLSVDAKYGKLDAKKFGELSDSLTKLQNEGYESALRMAQSGAKLEDVLAQFNKTGQAKFDASSVVSDKMAKGPGGVNTRVITYRDANGGTRSINTLSELDSLGKANETFNRFFNIQQNDRANASEGRAATNFNQSQQDRTSKQDAAVALYTETNPNASKAQINAVRSGILDAAPKGQENVSVDFRPDQSGYGGGSVVQKLRDGTMTITPVKPSKDGVPEIGKPMVIPGPRAAQQPPVVQKSQQELQPTAQAAPKQLQVTEADIEATAKKHGISKEAVRKQLGIK